MQDQKSFPIIVFADGASLGNPGPGGWGAIVALPDGRIKELGGREIETTNNRMELSAVIGALNQIRDCPGEVHLHTDSTYVIRGITEWIFAWRKKNWKTAEGNDVANVDLWKKLGAVLAARGKENPVRWKYVRGHTGIPGNERVDEIATTFGKGKRPELYSGPLLKYSVPIHDVPEDTSLPEMRPKAAPKAAPYSYLSLVGNSPRRHRTWAECEARVKGVSGARFKKAMNSEEERAILQSWGFTPDQVKAD